MTFTLPASIRSGARLCAAIRGGAHRVSWRAAAVTVVLSIAVGLYVGYRDDDGQISRVAVLPSYVLTGLCIMLVTFVADQWVATGGKRVLSYVCALVVASSAAALAQWPLHEWTGPLQDEPGLEPLLRIAHTAFLFSESLIWGSIIVFIYVNRRNAQQASMRMKSLQLQRTEMQRRSLESRLQALQARVEPQFLFDSLARVRDFYECDSVKGSQVLADLIAYLRAALPHLREPTSTLLQEVDLIVAYVNVMRARLAADVVCSVDMSDVSDVRMPAMVLLPLVGQMLSVAQGPVAIHIATRHIDATLRIDITQQQQLGAPAQSIERRDIEERLRGLYGCEWMLAAEPLGTVGTRVIVEIPYEPTDRRHR